MKLKPCPFCGKTNHLGVHRPASEAGKWWAYCTKIGVAGAFECIHCTGPFADNEAGAIRAWNRRPRGGK